jgi:hypothetical protein
MKQFNTVKEENKQNGNTAKPRLIKPLKGNPKW